MNSSTSGVRFLSFANDKEDSEKEARLKEAAAKIEQAIARDKSLNELVDYVPPTEAEEYLDPALDTRPLYERLLEQQNKKKEALEESQKLSNFVAKLDEEDINHLNEVSKQKHEEDLKKRLEVHDLLEQQKHRNEKKILDEEKKRKDSLLGRSDSKAALVGLSRLKSKIPLKMKPKPKSSSHPDAQDQKDTPHSSEGITESDSSRDNHKRQKLEQQDSNLYQTHSDMVCNHLNQQVMTCIGVLPSMPIVTKPFDEEGEEDSDNSDEDLDMKLPTRVKRGK